MHLPSVPSPRRVRWMSAILLAAALAVSSGPDGLRTVAGPVARAVRGLMLAPAARSLGRAAALVADTEARLREWRPE